jgi:tetratricopeptide (TPR) repeat protein
MSPKQVATLTVKHIFIASPRDLAEERELFPKILETINSQKAHSMRIHLQPLGWEDTLPGYGRPQALINKDVEKCDLFVMLVWKRWGTPPGNSRYSSGTEEEFALACRLHKKHKAPGVFLYFRDVPEAMLADPGEQLTKVLAFRARVEAKRKIFYVRYSDPDEWRRLLTTHIARWLDGPQLGLDKGQRAPSSEITDRLLQLENQVRKLATNQKDAQTKLREVAVDLARRAGKLAQEGRYSEAEELFAKSVQAYPQPSVLNAFGVLYARIGSLRRAEQKFREVERAGEEMEDKELLVIAYGNLGLVYWTRGELKRAKEKLRKAITIAEELGKKAYIASCYTNLGIVYLAGGDLKSAEQLHLKSLAIERQLGNKAGMAEDYNNLGIISKRRGDLKTAEKMYERALAIERKLGRIEGITRAYGNLSVVYHERGDIKAAEKIIRILIKWNKKFGNKKGLASNYGNLGLIYSARGDLKTSEQMHRKALAIEKKLGRKEGMAAEYCNLGLTLQDLGDRRRAEEMLRKSLTLFKEIGARPEVKKIGRALDKLRVERAKGR